MESLWKNIIGSIIRNFALPLTSLLMASGFFTESQVATFVSALIPLLIAVVWGIIDKYVVKNTVATALELPAGSSNSKLQDVLAAQK